MRAYDIIDIKKNGGTLTDEQIREFMRAYLEGEVEDYQVSALLMAICLRGMTSEETHSLTMAIRDSGDVLDFEGIEGFRVDKHSTGGVGDKTSLIVAPIVASLGVKVAKMSGRGLGHTGGTIDKLESIDSFEVSIDRDKFESIVNDIGLCIIGQTAEIAPLDKRLYALRDVTATVDSIPLIASSIMGKKLAMADDGIVLDVKCGKGAFMKSIEDSTTLARAMVDIGARAGKKTVAIITDMNSPLGYAIGNALEVREAIEVLKGKQVDDLRRLCICLSAHMLHLYTAEDISRCDEKCIEAIDSGRAYEKFRQMVIAQGGDVSLIDDEDKLLRARYSVEVLSEQSGYIYSQDAEAYGKIALHLGAGRRTKSDSISYNAGIILSKKVGDSVRSGEVIATLYADDMSLMDDARDMLLDATIISDTPPPTRDIILGEVR